jgi:hypothetical protein
MMRFFYLLSFKHHSLWLWQDILTFCKLSFLKIQFIYSKK